MPTDRRRACRTEPWRSSSGQEPHMRVSTWIPKTMGDRLLALARARGETRSATLKTLLMLEPMPAAVTPRRGRPPVGPEQPRDAQVSVRLTARQYDQIDAFARRERVTVKDVLRRGMARVLRDGLSRTEDAVRLRGSIVPCIDVTTSLVIVEFRLGCWSTGQRIRAGLLVCDEQGRLVYKSRHFGIEHRP